MKRFFKSVTKNPSKSSSSSSSRGNAIRIRPLRNLFGQVWVNERPNDLDSFVDPELHRVLTELHLQEYSENFARNRVILDDLPYLMSKEMAEVVEELIPDNIPRTRFLKYCKTRFFFVGDGETDGFLDPDLVTLEVLKDEEVGDSITNVFGKLIQRGRLVIRDLDETSKDCLVKTVPCDDTKDVMESCKRQFKGYNRIVHPNVVKFYGFFPNKGEGTVSLCFENLPNTVMTLNEYRRKNKSLSDLKKFQIALCMCNGLEKVQKGVGLKSLKPWNDIPSISLEELCPKKSSMDIYTSPEVFRGELIANDTKMKELSTVYSFGIILWEFWTGRSAFRHLLTEKDMLEKIHNKDDPIRPPLDVKELEGCLEDMLDLIIGCLEDDPEDRPPNFEFIREELEFYCSEEEKNKGEREEIGEENEETIHIE